MANNYIKLGNEDLIDLRSDTVASNKMLTGTTAHDASGAAISGSIQSGNVSLTLTPSNLTPSTSPNKYVPSASASLDYSSLTADKTTVQSGKTFIGKNGYDTGTLVAPSVTTGETTTSNSKQFTISNLSGTPSNVILMYVGSDSITSSIRVHRLYYINGTVYARTTGNNYDRHSIIGVTFDNMAHTCTIAYTSTGSTAIFETNKTYRYVVW